MIKNAMIFAAGFGKRAIPYTYKTPKPLLKINGKSLIDIVIDRLIEYKIENIVVNCHYHAEQLITHLKDKKKIIISHENEILETGGGLLKALPILGEGYILTVNADTIWYESDLLLQLTSLWQNKSKPNLAIVLYESSRMINYKGEFEILSNNKVTKSGNFVYAGIQIINTKLLQGINKKYFSLSEIHDLLIKKNDSDVYGIEYKGNIFHIGSAKEFEKLSSKYP